MNTKIETIFLLFLIFCASFIVGMTSLTMYQNYQDAETFIINMIVLYSVFACIVVLASVKLSMLQSDANIDNPSEPAQVESNKIKSDWGISHTLMVVFFSMAIISGFASEFDNTENSLIVCMISGIITSALMTYQMYRLPCRRSD